MNTQPPLLEIIDASAAKDAALASVSAGSPDFMDAGMAVIERLRGEFTGEQIRLHLESLGIVPNHPNCMGALIRAAFVQGLLTDTGRVEKMQGPKSNARRTPVWRVGG